MRSQAGVVGFHSGVVLSTVGKRLSVVGSLVVMAAGEEEGRACLVLSGTETENLTVLSSQVIGPSFIFNEPVHGNTHFLRLSVSALYTRKQTHCWLRGSPGVVSILTVPA